MAAPGDLLYASTVILLREGTEGPEVFMMRRHLRSDFVGGAYVFPGGVVDSSDHLPEDLSRGVDDTLASATLGLECGGLAFWIAGIRESFEEAGVMLAYDRAGSIVCFEDPPVCGRFRQYRDALNRRELAFEEILRREDLRLATDRLHYWAHWVTPEGQARRYDTRFFLALAPVRQTAAHDGWELTDSAWIRPQAALQRARAGEWTIIFPTLRNLESLCRFATADDAERAARRLGPVTRIQPRLVRDARGFRIVVPGERGYESEQETVDAAQALNYSTPSSSGETDP